MNFFLKILATGLAVFLTAYLLPGIHLASDLWTILIVALVITLLNVTLKPILIFITIPATIVTFGLFLFVINAIIIMVADYFVDGFTVDSFWWALLFSLIVSFIVSLFKDEKKKG